MSEGAVFAITPRESELTANHNADLFDAFPMEDGTDFERERWRDFRKAYHSAHRLEGISKYPLQLDFALNSTCQMKCRFCAFGQEGYIMPKAEFPLEVFKRTMIESEKHGLCSVKLNYINEPLLRRDIPHFVEIARDHGVLNVYFATNGLLLKDDLARCLIDVGVSKIMVSLDAHTEKTFLKMRRSKHFKQIKKNILDFIRLRNSKGLRFPLIRVNFLRTKVNQHEADSFIAYWKDKSDMIGFQTQVQMPGVDDDLIAGHELVTDPRAPFRCSFPYKLLTIDYNGQILPCCTFSGRVIPVGNIYYNSIADTWLNNRMKKIRSAHLFGQGRRIPACDHCIGGHS